MAYKRGLESVLVVVVGESSRRLLFIVLSLLLSYALWIVLGD